MDPIKIDDLTHLGRADAAGNRDPNGAYVMVVLTEQVDFNDIPQALTFLVPAEQWPEPR